MGVRKGFTLTELLVCIALTAVLLALSLPLIGRVRTVAMNTVCSSRLRDLTVASNLYRNEFDSYPKLGPGRDAPPAALAALVNLPQPQEMDAAFLNAVVRYLNVPAIPAWTTAASDLPPIVQCPMAEATPDDARDTMLPVSFAAPSFYTGYAYVGRVDEQPPASALSAAAAGAMRIELLRPERAATRRNASAVLWADDVHWKMAGGGAWSYAHRRPCKDVRAGPLALTLDKPDALGGQHRAYTDGRVEWEPAEAMDLRSFLAPGAVIAPGANGGGGGGASLRIEPIFYLWF